MRKASVRLSLLIQDSVTSRASDNTKVYQIRECKARNLISLIPESETQTHLLPLSCLPRALVEIDGALHHGYLESKTAQLLQVCATFDLGMRISWLNVRMLATMFSIGRYCEKVNPEICLSIYMMRLRQFGKVLLCLDQVAHGFFVGKKRQTNL